MSHYNHTIIFICPVSQLETAKSVSRALDPDVGGYEAFDSFASADGLEPATHVIYGSPVRDDFVATVQFLIDNNTTIENRAVFLKQMLDVNYAARWPNFEPPTLAECQSFIAAMLVFIDVQWNAVLEQESLVIVTDGNS